MHTIPPMPPIRMQTLDGATVVPSVIKIIVSNGTLTDLGGGTVKLATGSGSGGSSITFPLITGSGGTGLNYVGSGGMVFGVNTGGTGTEYKVLTAGANITITHAGSTITFAATTGAAAAGAATTAETYIVIANTNSLSSERALTAGLGVGIADSGANAGVYISVGTPFVVTSNRTINVTAPVLGGGNLSTDRTISVDTACLVTTGRTITEIIDLRPMTVSNANANAFWASSAMTNFNIGYMGFSDGVTGTVTYFGEVPGSLATVPAWNIYAHAMPASGAAGSAAFTIKAKTFGNGTNFDQALTTIVNTLSYPIVATGTMSLITFSANSFDATEALTSNNILIVEVSRLGGNAGDSLNGQQLNLLSVFAKANVIS